MKATSSILLGATAALGLFLAAPSFAQGPSGGKEVPYEESARSLGGVATPKGNARSIAGAPADRSAGRDLLLDPQVAKSAYTLIGRTSTGEEIRREPSEDVIRAIRGERAPGDQRGAIEGDTSDPAFTEAGEERAVIGSDNRVRVASTRTYPFTTVGYMDMLDPDEQVWTCTATMIGPRVAITAARCLYNHEGGGWLNTFDFWPALASSEDAPFGGISASTVYVFNAFISNYDGSYDAIWPYDVGIVEFDSAVGDRTGWLTYWNYSDLGDFQANMVAYHDDKESYTQWRSPCTVYAENVRTYDFLHDCDGDWGALGAPIYVFDRNVNARIIVGINQGDDGDLNWGLRIHDAVFAWLEEFRQQ